MKQAQLQSRCRGGDGSNFPSVPNYTTMCKGAYLLCRYVRCSTLGAVRLAEAGGLVKQDMARTRHQDRLVESRPLAAKPTEEFDDAAPRLRARLSGGHCYH